MHLSGIAEWEDLKSPLLPHLNSLDGGSQILVPGCGNSRLSEYLYDEGFKGITNIDFSKVAITGMLRKNVRSGRRWRRVMDMTLACRLSRVLMLDDESFDAVVAYVDWMLMSLGMKDNLSRLCPISSSIKSFVDSNGSQIENSAKGKLEELSPGRAGSILTLGELVASNHFTNDDCDGFLLTKIFLDISHASLSMDEIQLTSEGRMGLKIRKPALWKRGNPKNL
ncbi:hypothetical protein Leryth_019704 [Lithospermum erythrorhizon]|nr:hypothetical protein Leryth_019704 [Lithospermum erythrorhizon]